jgi:hypothetical protein
MLFVRSWDVLRGPSKHCMCPVPSWNVLRSCNHTPCIVYMYKYSKIYIHTNEHARTHTHSLSLSLSLSLSHTDSNASALCKPCAAGKYSNSTGATMCVQCPGQASSPVASLTSSACTCNKATSLSPSLSCLSLSLSLLMPPRLSPVFFFPARRQSFFLLHVQTRQPLFSSASVSPSRTVLGLF